MIKQLNNLTNTFASPYELFDDLKNNPKWFFLFIILTILFIGISWQLLPYTQKIMLNQLAMRLGEEKAEQAFAVSQRFQYLGLLFVPFPLLVKWFLIAVALYYSAILFEAQNVNFKAVFSVVVHSELILLFMGIINILILQIKGINAVNNMTDLQTIIGLDYFLSNKLQNIPLFIFLNNFNIFTIWYVIILTIGITIVSQLEKWKSALIVSLVWLFGVCIQVAFSYFSVQSQQMLGH